MIASLSRHVLAVALLAVCAASSAGNLVVSVLDKDGKPVPDAVVTVIPANKSAQPKNVLPSQATISQEKMQFVPAVTVVPVGAKVHFVNNDPWDHHVRSSPAGMGQFNSAAAGFELRLEGKAEGKPGKVVDVVMDKPGVVGATLLGCFIHGSMRGYVFISETPWAARTTVEGLAIFEDLPDGLAQVKVWQSEQQIDIAAQQVTVGAALAKSVMQLTVLPRRRRT